ncbi:MAG: hypothetical protein JWR60_2590 [Polaromonas sp.]|nr:hypothetical protein [Polaromonas sp.]
MKTALRRLLVAAVAALPLAAAVAQTTPAPAEAAQAAPAGSKRPDQKIERIRTEDAGSRIDELRVGGETKQITVQPKNGSAPYEVRPAGAAGSTSPGSSDRDTSGSRVWNVLKF